MEFIYPAVFHPNDNGSYTITFPDLPGAISEGKTLSNAMVMARSALAQWVEYLQDKGKEVPEPSSARGIVVHGEEFVSLIYAVIKDEKAVKRTVSIPAWMDAGAIEHKLSLSKVLQEALREKLQ